MPRLYRQLICWAKVLLSQAIMLGVIWLIRDFLPQGQGWLLPVLVLSHGLLSGLIGWLLGLSWQWLPIQLLLPVALVYGGLIPSWVFLLLFVGFALTFSNSPSERVPLYLSNRRTRDALVDLARRAQAASFVDLGCGTGGVVLHLARAIPTLHAVGVETAPTVYAIARMRQLLGPANARIRFSSLWRENLAAFDIVYCFLSPAPMAELYAKAKVEMRPGTLFVSNSFAVPDVEADEVLAPFSGRQTGIFVYRM